MTRQLEGKVAIVTGGGSGIGRGAALTLADAGAIVTVADLDPIGGRETVAAIESLGGTAQFVATDVGDETQVAALVAKVVAEYGRLDIGFNNAGIPGTVGVLTADHDLETWNRVIQVNLKGVFLCLKHELRQMVAQGSGTIVNTASITGLGAFRGCPAYVASKHGIIGLTRAAALEYGHQGIRVNAICPGFVRTPLLPSDSPETEAKLAGRVPLGRIGEPEEIGRAVLWLCSDASSYVTAHPLVVDGGMLSQL